MAKTHSTAERDAAVNMQTTNQYWWIGIKWKWYDGAANIHEVPHNRRMYRLYRNVSFNFYCHILTIVSMQFLKS